MKKIIIILAMLCCPSVFAATLTANTVPYVCQGGTSPQLCNSTTATDNQGNIQFPSIPSNVQLFTSSGTWINPGNKTRIWVQMRGGGGGDGGYDNNCDPNGNGGNGAYAEGPLTVSGNVQVTVGVAGVNGGGGTNGSPGGTSSVLSMSATGGGGGQGNGSNGQDGTSSGGQISTNIHPDNQGLGGQSGTAQIDQNTGSCDVSGPGPRSNRWICFNLFLGVFMLN